MNVNDISLKRKVDDLKKECIDRIVNLVKANGFNEGDEYVLDFVKIPRLVFYIDGGERICIDQISYVKNSGDLFGENIEDFDNVVKYDMKKFFSVDDFAAIESHFYSFEKLILDEKRKEKWYVLIQEEDGNTDDRSTDVFEDEDTAITVMNDNYLACVKNTKLISGVEKQITDNIAYVKVGKKNYYRARIIEKTMPFAVIYGDMFSYDLLGTYFVLEFLTYSAALRYVNELRIEDYMIV